MYVASLPWYDLKEIESATNAFWRALGQNLRGQGVCRVPDQLNRHDPYSRQWCWENFLFGQACGYDVLLAYPDRLQLVATPCYAAPGCATGEYCSFVVVREGSPFRSLADLRDSRCVINTPTSHSGMNILRALVAPLNCRGRFFSQVEISGAHQSSLDMILGGHADVAAIDCVTYALLQQQRPQALRGTRVLCQSRQVPAPPYVTSAATPAELVARLRTALALTLDDPDIGWAKRQLLLQDVVFWPLEAYEPIGELQRLAGQHGYHELQMDCSSAEGSTAPVPSTRRWTENISCGG